MSTVNVAEVSAHLRAQDWRSDQVKDVFDDLSIEVFPFERATALLSGAYRPRTHHLGLGLGDKACLPRPGGSVFRFSRGPGVGACQAQRREGHPYSLKHHIGGRKRMRNQHDRVLAASRPRVVGRSRRRTCMRPTLGHGGLAALLTAALLPPPPLSALTTALRYGRRIDGISAEARENVTVIVRDGRVAELRDGTAVPDGAGRALDIRGGTCLPGMVSRARGGVMYPWRWSSQPLL